MTEKYIIDICPDCGNDLEGKNWNYCKQCGCHWAFKKAKVSGQSF